MYYGYRKCPTAKIKNKTSENDLKSIPRARVKNFEKNAWAAVSSPITNLKIVKTHSQNRKLNQIVFLVFFKSPIIV